MSTARDLITVSLRLIGAIASGEPLSANEGADGLSALNLLIASWSNEKLLIPTLMREVFPLVSGQQVYTMGAGGNWNTARPQRIEKAEVQVPSGGPTLELPMHILTQEQYAGLPLKTLQGGYPAYLMEDNAFPLDNVYIYPVPNSGYSIALYSWKPLTELTNLSTALSLPPGYERALKYALAIELAPEYGKEASATVVAIAVESKAAIKRMNTKPRYLKSDTAFLSRPTNFGYFAGGPEFPIFAGAGSSGTTTTGGTTTGTTGGTTTGGTTTGGTTGGTTGTTTGGTGTGGTGTGGTGTGILTSITPTSITAWSPSAGGILTAPLTQIVITCSGAMDPISTGITTKWVLKSSSGSISFQNIAKPIVLTNNGSATTIVLNVQTSGVLSNSLIIAECVGALDAAMNELVGYTAAGWIYETGSSSSQNLNPARLYFPSTGTAPYTPASVDSGWGASNSLVTLPALYNKAGTANTGHANTFAAGSNVYTATLQYVSPPLTAQTISGTAEVVASMQASAGTGNQCAPKYTVYVISPAGVVRGVLCQHVGGTHSVFDTSQSIFTYNDTLTLTSVTAQAGDYLVIERGFNRFNTGSTTITTYIGDSSATDEAFAYENTDYTDNSWIEFESGLTFQSTSGTQGTTTVLDTVPASGSLITSSTTSIAFDFSAAMDTGGTVTSATNWVATSTSGSISLSNPTLSNVNKTATVPFTLSGVTAGSIISIAPGTSVKDGAGHYLAGSPAATFEYVASIPSVAYFPNPGVIRTLPTQIVITFPSAMAASAGLASSWSAASSTGSTTVTAAQLSNNEVVLTLTPAGVYSGSTITITGTGLTDTNSNPVSASVTYNYYNGQVGATDGLPFVLYGTTSSWNQLMPSGVASNLWASSSSVITTLFTDSSLFTSSWNGHTKLFDLSLGALGPYFLTTPATDPAVTITETGGYGWLNGKTVPMPAATSSGASSGDAHAAVLNMVSGDEYGYFGDYASNNPTPIHNGQTVTVYVGIKTNLYTGTGWDAGNGTNGAPGTLTAGFGGILTSAGSQEMAGTVTLDEFKLGRINHKLSMAVGKNYAANGVWPATAAAKYPATGTGVGIGPGSLIWCDLTDTQVDALNWDPVSSMLLKALHNYGGFITDQNGFCAMDIRGILAVPGGNAAEAAAATTWWNANTNGGFPKLMDQTASWFEAHFHVVDPTWLQTQYNSVR